MTEKLRLIIKDKIEDAVLEQYIQQLKKYMGEVEIQVVRNIKTQPLQNVMNIVKEIENGMLSELSISHQRIVFEGLIKAIMGAYEKRVKASVHPRGWQSPNLNTYWVRTGTTKRSVNDKVKSYKKTGGFTIFGAIGSSEKVTFEGLVKFRKRYKPGYRKKTKRTVYYKFVRIPKGRFKFRNRKEWTRERKLSENRKAKFAFKTGRLFRTFYPEYSGFMKKVIKTRQVRGKKYKAKAIWYSHRVHKPYKIFHILEDGRGPVAHFGPFEGYHYTKNIVDSFTLDFKKELSDAIEDIINKVAKRIQTTLIRQEKALQKHVQ